MEKQHLLHLEQLENSMLINKSKTKAYKLNVDLNSWIHAVSTFKSYIYDLIIMLLVNFQK